MTTFRAAICRHSPRRQRAKRTRGTAENNEGYLLGDPVYIPKVYNGKHKTFFLANFECDHYNDMATNGFITVTPTECKTKLFDPSWTGVDQSGSTIGTDALAVPSAMVRYHDQSAERTTRYIAATTYGDPTYVAPHSAVFRGGRGRTLQPDGGFEW